MSQVVKLSRKVMDREGMSCCRSACVGVQSEKARSSRFCFWASRGSAWDCCELGLCGSTVFSDSSPKNPRSIIFANCKMQKPRQVHCHNLAKPPRSIEFEGKRRKNAMVSCQFKRCLYEDSLPFRLHDDIDTTTFLMNVHMFDQVPSSR